MRRYISEGGDIPRWYGVAYRQIWLNRVVCYPLPLNVLVRAWEHARVWLRSPLGKVTRREQAEIEAWCNKWQAQQLVALRDELKRLTDARDQLLGEIAEAARRIERYDRSESQVRHALGAGPERDLAEAASALMHQRNELVRLADSLTQELRAGIEVVCPPPVALASEPLTRAERSWIDDILNSSEEEPTK